VSAPTLALPAPDVVTAAGLYDGMPEPAYLADPVPSGSLSSSGAVALLEPSCPALYRYQRDNPSPSTDAQRFGSGAHRELLGEGPDLFLYDRLDGRTKAGKALAKDIAAAVAEGLIPMTRDEHARTQAMVKALREVPEVAALFDPANGRPEQSGFWRDPETGQWCRCRFDFLPHAAPSGRLIFPDYKTAKAVDDDSIDKAVAKWHYHQKVDLYERGARALGLGDHVTGVLVFQMSDPPHLVRLVQPDEEARAVGHRRNRRALDLFHACQTSGKWPGFGTDVYPSRMPVWALYAEPED